MLMCERLLTKTSYEEMYTLKKNNAAIVILWIRLIRVFVTLLKSRVLLSVILTEYFRQFLNWISSFENRTFPLSGWFEFCVWMLSWKLEYYVRNCRSKNVIKSLWRSFSTCEDSMHKICMHKWKQQLSGEIRFLINWFNFVRQMQWLYLN